MNTAKKNGEKVSKPAINPFVKAMEDKKAINAALQAGIPLSTLKGLKFVRPI